MKNARALMMISLSVVAGVVAVALAARWVGQQANDNSARVVVAAQDLELGAPVNAPMLQVIAWPAGAVPVGSFADVAKLEGRVVRSPVFKGEPILEPKLAPVGTKGGLPSMIEGGKRAISVKVNEVVGVAGFALPGSFVDVMVNTTDNKDKAVSRIVLNRILVLAVAQEANRDETKPKVVNAVTLEVAPDEAEKIDLARSIGTLSLVLRNPIDKVTVETTGVRRDDLLAKEAAVPLPPVPPVQLLQRLQPRVKAMPLAAPPVVPAVATVEVIRGVQKANSEF